MTDAARALLDAIALDGASRDRVPPTVRLGTVDPSDGGSGGVKVTFDGETTVGTVAYPYIGARRPEASDRVVLLRQGRGYVVLGALSPAPLVLTDLQPDTDWITSGLTWGNWTGDWAVSSYKIRKIGSHVIGELIVTFSGTTVVANGDGNIADSIMGDVPSGWEAVSMSGGWQLGIALNGERQYYGRLDVDELRFTHAGPGVELTNGDDLVVKLDYWTD